MTNGCWQVLSDSKCPQISTPFFSNLVGLNTAIVQIRYQVMVGFENQVTANFLKSIFLSFLARFSSTIVRTDNQDIPKFSVPFYSPHQPCLLIYYNKSSLFAEIVFCPNLRMVQFLTPSQVSVYIVCLHGETQTVCINPSESPFLPSHICFYIPFGLGIAAFSYNMVLSSFTRFVIFLFY